MKILALHTDYISFRPLKKAIKGIADLPKKDSEGNRVEEALAIMTAVEKSDEGSVDAVVNKLLEEVEKIAEQVKAENIVLYPYAHLSKDLASVETATEVLEKAFKALGKIQSFQGTIWLL